MKVLVTGGRNYAQATFLRRFLDNFHFDNNITCLVHGDAGESDDSGIVLWGADRLAGEWAYENGIVVRSYPANWERYGKRAGYLRNFKMLECEDPDLVIAFPGGPGTKNQVTLSLTAGVPVLDALTKKILYPISKEPPATLPGMDDDE